MKVLVVTQNDKGYDILFTIKDSTGVVVGLTDVTGIKFQVATQNDYTTLLDGACVITDVLSGKCKYTVKEGNFPNCQNYYGVLRLTYSDGRILSVKKFYVNVEPEMA